MEFLTDEELEIYTGYKRPTEQIKWLKEEKLVPFTINGQAKPVVIFKHVFGFRRDGVENSSLCPNELNWKPDPPKLPHKKY